MKKLSLFVVGLLILSLILAGCLGTQGKPAADTPKPRPLTHLAFGSGAMGGNLYLHASTLATIAAGNPDLGLSITVQSTGGFSENMNRLARKQMDLGWIDAPGSAMAFGGVGEFAGKAEEFKHLRGIMAIPYGGIQVVTLARHDIHTLSDLKGKRVAIGAAGSMGARLFMPALLGAAGVTSENSTLMTLGAEQASDAIKNRDIEARAASSRAPLASVTSLAITEPIRLLGTDAATLKKVIAQLPGTYQVTLPKDMYPNQDNKEDIQTLGFAALMATHDGVSEEVVYNLTKALWENVTMFGDAVEIAREWKLQNALVGMSIPLHEGAERFYREKGILR